MGHGSAAAVEVPWECFETPLSLLIVNYNPGVEWVLDHSCNWFTDPHTALDPLYIVSALHTRTISPIVLFT